MITYDVDENMVNEVEKKLGELRSKAPTVISRAINKTATTARVDLSTKARSTYTVKNKDFKKDMEIRKASAGRLEAVIRSEGKPLPISDFHVTAPKSGAKANIIKGGGMKPLVKGNIKAFQTGVQTGHIGTSHKGIFQRKGKNRFPIKQLYSNSVPKMIGNEERVYGKIEPSIQKNLQHYVDQQIELLTGKGGR